MALAHGTRLGPYEVTALIGRGGMGEVHRAHDINLNRDVALKILPESFALDADRVARFKREAQVLASLNHPNIAAIYGLEEADGIRALVLELVEGPTLADRIRQGPIPLNEALPIARQIAEALEAAHEHGIVHRDLKPANIKVRPDGAVKVLDFGLAKALDSSPSATDVSQLPTITSPAMTDMGVILGTAAYMSPEQARGKPVDKRADIWAFGCVLYEMLAGTRAFRGETVSETLADVMKSEPRWTALPPETPSALRNVVRRCLEKDPRQRVRDIGDVRLALEEGFESAAVEATAVAVPQLRFWQRSLLLVAAVVTASVVTGLAIWTLTRPSPPRVLRATVTPSGASALVVGGSPSLAISPEGTRLVYVGDQRLFVRALDQLQPTALQGLGNPNTPFFSPDGQWIGFFDFNNALMKVATTGGPPVTITPFSANAAGASWGADDTIIFATTDRSSGLLRVAAGGGEPEVLTRPQGQGEFDHWWPEVLPGGQAVLFTIMAGALDNAQIAVLDLTTRQQKILIRGGSHAHYASSGHLVYGVAGTLRAVAFDLRRLEVLGTPVPVLEQVMTTAGGAANVSISGAGTLVYVSGGIQADPPGETLVWVDRQGREEPIKAPPRSYRYPRLSPDGTRVAVDVRGQGADIWIWDLQRETLTRFTFNSTSDEYPVWTPDGRRLLFRSQRSGPHNIFWQAADGTGVVERLTESPNEQAPYAVSPDGTRLVFREDVRATGQDLKALTLQGERRAEALVQTAFTERDADISPDGRWLAYASNESGQQEIYVRPFPGVNSGRWQISTGGGRTPLWARNGKELFYRAPDGAVLGVAVEVAGGANFTAGRPAKLVEGRYFAGATGGAGLGRSYDVSPDGQRFLMIKQAATDATSAPREIIVVQNWIEELKRLVPTR